MEDLKHLSGRAFLEGMPSERVKFTSTFVHFTEIENLDQWKSLDSIFYSTGDARDGLLSGLGLVLEDVTAAVKTAFDSCEATVKGEKSSLTAFLTQVEKATLPLDPKNVYDSLHKAWNDLDAAGSSLEHVQRATNSKNSLPSLFSHLSKAHDPVLRSIQDWLATITKEFDHIAWKRHFLENAYEIHRLDTKQVYIKWLEWFSGVKSKCDLLTLREIWNPSDAFYFWHSSTFIHYLQMVQKTPPAQLNITDGSVTLPPNCVVFEGPDNSAFQFVHVNNIRDLTFYYRDEIPSGTNIRETAFEFDRFICAEQSILKAISQPGGPWASEIPKKKLFRAAITLEGYLNITLEYMNELADLVEDLRTDAINQVTSILPSLRRDLHDLHTSLHFGDTEDQKESIQRLRKSVDAWQSSIYSVKSRITSTIPCYKEFVPRYRTCQACLAENGFQLIDFQQFTDPGRVIFGLTCLDTSNAMPLSIKTGLSDQNRPEITAFNSCKTYLAKAQYLELPPDGIFDWGRQSTLDRDMRLDRKPEDPLVLDFLINFKQPFPFGASPVVVAWIDGISCSSSANYRASIEINNIGTTQFTLRITSWADTKLELLNVSWFAYPSDSPYIVSGKEQFVKRGKHSEVSWAPYVDVKFVEGKFIQPPLIFTAISGLDIDNRRNPRFQAQVTNVTGNGFRLAGTAWHDTHNYGSSISYIAFDKRFFPKTGIVKDLSAKVGGNQSL